MVAVGLLIVEMTNGTMDGWISTLCASLCNDEYDASLNRVVDFCKTYGVAKLGIQLGHAGRKGSQHPPALGGKAMTADEGGWETVGPSAIPFSDYRSEEHTSELKSLMRISYAVFCLKKTNEPQ